MKQQPLRNAVQYHFLVCSLAYVAEGELCGEALQLLQLRGLPDVAVELEHALVEQRALLVAEQLRLLRGEAREARERTRTREARRARDRAAWRDEAATQTRQLRAAHCDAARSRRPQAHASASADSVYASESSHLLRGWLRLLSLVQVSELVTLYKYCTLCTRINNC